MGETVVVLASTVAREDVPVLCASLLSRLGGDRPGVVVCDVRELLEPDVVAVDALARLQVTARRAGATVVLRHAGPELRSLLDLIGLGDALVLDEGSSPEAGLTSVGHPSR